VQNILVINNMRLNWFYTCAFVGFVTDVYGLKKLFEIYVIKFVHSFDSTLSHVMQTSIRFPIRSLERSKTNISRHICIIQDVISVEIRKRKIHKNFLCIWDGIRKWSALAYFCEISTH